MAPRWVIKAGELQLYNSWRAMRERCGNPAHEKFSTYGGAGVTCFAPWGRYSTFRTWALENGYAPGLTIDRRENGLGYSPENCRWATAREQTLNRENVAKAPDGTAYCDIAASNAVKIKTYQARISRGWPPELAATIKTGHGERLMAHTPHPKPAPKAKKPGAMRSKPKTALEVGTAAHAAMLDGAEPAAAIAAATAPKPAKAPKVAAKAKKAPVAKPTAPEGGSKTDMLLGMLRKPGGASSKEMEAATGWAPHSVRGFLGTLRKKGVNVVAKKFKGEPTVYSLGAAAPTAPAAAPEPVGDVV